MPKPPAGPGIKQIPMPIEKRQARLDLGVSFKKMSEDLDAVGKPEESLKAAELAELSRHPRFGQIMSDTLLLLSNIPEADTKSFLGSHKEAIAKLKK